MKICVKKKTLNAATNSIRFKYSIIRYIYSQMMLISIGEKGSYFKPAFFEFINVVSNNHEVEVLGIKKVNE